MVLTCPACSAKLTIADENVPKDAVFKVTCPKCQEKIQVSTKREEGEAPLTLQAVPSASIAEEGASPSPAEDDFVENRRLALVCLDHAQGQPTVTAALAALGYTMHVAASPGEGVEWLRKNRYEVMILHEEFGGSPDANIVLQTLQPMMMTFRRHMCVGLVGKQFRTFDRMAAFAQSVNFVVAERDLTKLKAIVNEAVSENDQFYRVFREALHEAGKL
ncbi:MAG TPA: zinc-ribbon domain-containing protein [Nitrospirales bacterium]|nr:zinc-ribbon domain-containing protein [Nitrospirales bacterium]